MTKLLNVSDYIPRCWRTSFLKMFFFPNIKNDRCIMIDDSHAVSSRFKLKLHDTIK